MASGVSPEAEICLLEGLATTRAIRRYTDDPVPDEALQAMLFAASRAPTGSNSQRFRFIVLRDGPTAEAAKRLIGDSARAAWAHMRARDGYDDRSGTVPDSPKARMARTLQHFVDNFDRVPVLILPCLLVRKYRSPMEGASIYPACQNLLLAARALGFGGVLTGYQVAVDKELRSLLGVPEDVFVAATITVGRPQGSHGPVRRLPLQTLVYEGRWGEAASWAVDPEGVSHTGFGPPRRAAADTSQNTWSGDRRDG
jgi:nitroreductase